MKKLILLFLLVGCSNYHKPIIPAIKDSDYCLAAHNNITKLHCTFEDKHHRTFLQFCLDTRDNALWLNPKCLSLSNYCSQASNCIFK